METMEHMEVFEGIFRERLKEVSTVFQVASENGELAPFNETMKAYMVGKTSIVVGSWQEGREFNCFVEHYKLLAEDAAETLDALAFSYLNVAATVTLRDCLTVGAIRAAASLVESFSNVKLYCVCGSDAYYHFAKNLSESDKALLEDLPDSDLHQPAKRLRGWPWIDLCMNLSLAPNETLIFDPHTVVAWEPRIVMSEDAQGSLTVLRIMAFVNRPPEITGEAVLINTSGRKRRDLEPLQSSLECEGKTN